MWYIVLLLLLFPVKNDSALLWDLEAAAADRVRMTSVVDMTFSFCIRHIIYVD